MTKLKKTALRVFIIVLIIAILAPSTALAATIPALPATVTISNKLLAVYVGNTYNGSGDGWVKIDVPSNGQMSYPDRQHRQHRILTIATRIT